MCVIKMAAFCHVVVNKKRLKHLSSMKVILRYQYHLPNTPPVIITVDFLQGASMAINGYGNLYFVITGGLIFLQNYKRTKKELYCWQICYAICTVST